MKSVMENIGNKSNNELVLEAKSLNHEYEATKSRIVHDLDKLKELEMQFKKINSLLLSRNV